MTGANQQQAHHELALRLVFERSPDAILLLYDGVFIDCNQAAVDMLRAAGKDELLSLSPSDPRLRFSLTALHPRPKRSK